MSKVIHKFHNNLNQFSHSLLHRGQKSKDPYNKQTYFNPARLLLKTLGTSGIFSPRCSRTFSNPDSKFNNYINNSKNLRIAGFSSAFVLLILSTLLVYPLVRNLNTAEAASPTDSTTTLNITTTNSANVQLLVKDSGGTFASSSSSESLNFNVTTNNYTGYKLTLLGKDSTYANLVNSSTNTNLTSISESKDSSSFSNGYWGYTLDNGSTYLPAPDNKTGDTIDDTNVANTTANNYTLGLGVKADYSTKTGVYTNTYVLTAVGNPTPYTLNFNKSTTDTVENMPSTTSDSVKDTKVALPTNVPTRTGYTFAGWCDTEPTANSNGSNNCSGTTYQPSTESTTVYYDFINRTAETNIANLYAVWNINQYTCTKQYRLQNASGGWGSYVSDDSEQLDYNSTCTYTKSVADYTGVSGTNNQAGTKSATMTEDKTLSIDMYRNTYVLTIDKDSYISSVTGAGTYRWGQSVSISATASSGSEFVNWTQPSGTTGSFGSTTSASTTFTMGKGAATIRANGKTVIYIQDYTAATCKSEASSVAKTVTDKRDNNTYTVRYINENCWMTQNLRYIGDAGSASASMTMKSATSNISADKTISYTDFIDSGSYVAAQLHMATNDQVPPGATFTVADMGVWYNYAAASAMTITGESNTNTQAYDICPKNWKLPTRSQQSTINSYVEASTPITGGRYTEGVHEHPEIGFWWSASASNYSQSRWRQEYSGGKLNTTYNNNRTMGYYVRCIRSS